MATHRREGSHASDSLPEKLGVCVLHWIPQLWGPAQDGGDISKNNWLWKPMGLTSRVSSELWGTEILLLRNSHADSFVPGTSAKAAV